MFFLFFCSPALQLIITYFLGSPPPQHRRRRRLLNRPHPHHRAEELSTPSAAAPCPRLTCLSPSLQPNESQTNDGASEELTIPPHLRCCFITAVSNGSFEDESGEPVRKERKERTGEKKTGQQDWTSFNCNLPWNRHTAVCPMSHSFTE